MAPLEQKVLELLKRVDELARSNAGAKMTPTVASQEHACAADVQSSAPVTPAISVASTSHVRSQPHGPAPDSDGSTRLHTMVKALIANRQALQEALISSYRFLQESFSARQTIQRSSSCSIC
jgi:hypothetical protein